MVFPCQMPGAVVEFAYPPGINPGGQGMDYNVVKALRASCLLIFVLSVLNPRFPMLHAQTAVFTYQGRVTVAGTNFSGPGQFEFALVTSTNSSRQATAVASMGGIAPNQFVSSCAVLNPGNGYTGPAAVTFTGGGGSGATAVANISGGMVSSITVLTPGSGYSGAPTATIDPPPPNISFTSYWSNDGTSVNGSQPGAAVGVNVNGGLFTVVLGDTSLPNMAALPVSVFAQPNLELRIWFNDGVHGFAALSPTQKLTPAPYAITSGSASNLLGEISASQLVGTVPAGQISGSYPGAVQFNNTSNSFSGAFSGNGGGITNVSANSLVPTSTYVSITSWGWNGYGQRTIPAGLVNASEVSAGAAHSLALKSDGTVAAWGAGASNNPSDGVDFGQAMVPAGLSNVVAVSAGYLHSMALRADGTVVAWGAGTTNDTNSTYELGQSIVPPGLIAQAISAGGLHSLALKADGTVVAWGDGTTNDPSQASQHGQAIVPPGLSNVVAISGGLIFSLALRSNGTVVVWGDGQYGETNVPPGLSNVVAISAGGAHALALRNNGTVVAWGGGMTNDPSDGVDYGQSIVPPGLSNVISIAAGLYNSLALKADGTVVAWGDDDQGQSSVPPGLSNLIGLAAGCGAEHVLALRKQASAPVAWLDSDNTFNGNITVNGDTTVSGEMSASDLRLNDGNLWLRSGGDQNNGLGWFGSAKSFGSFYGGAPDGPVLFGEGGGALGTSTTTNGQTVALAWDSSQRVGIGTTTPEARLDLGGDSANTKLLLNDSYGGPGLGAYGSQMMLNLGGDGGRFSFMSAPGGTELLSVLSYGSVGIGTASPNGRLDVRGTIFMGSSGQYAATGAQESLRIIRGVVRNDGVILAGTGFTVVHNGTGSYTVSFTTPFSGMPAITVSVQHGTGEMATTSNVGDGSTYVDTWDASGAASDQFFHFIAIGPQ